MAEPKHSDKQKIVILGTGFGSLSMLSRLNTKKFDVSVVSPRAYFLYTPLLAPTTAGLVNFESIVEPVRFFGNRKKKDFKYYEAVCEDVDLENNKVHCKPIQASNLDFNLEYDYLIMAVGGFNETFNISGVGEHCNFFNSLNDGRRIRNKIIDSIEIANLPDVPSEEKERLLHCVVVGGGPVARETASMIYDFMQEKISSMSPESAADLLKFAKVTIVKTVDHIHNYYDYAISKRYTKICNKSEIDVIHDEIVKVESNDILLKTPNGETKSLPYSTCIWATGKTIQPLAKKVAQKLEQQDNSLALVVDPTLKLLGTSNVYAIGDCSTICQKTLLQKWENLFLEHDTNQDGVIDRDEFSRFAEKLALKYPGLKEIIRREENFFQWGDLNKDGKLQALEFKKLINDIDKTLTRFPSTASTALQQGAFLGEFFNNGQHLLDKTDNVFRYKHIGGYEYVGAEEGVVERGSKGTAIITGMGAEWMWTNVYYSTLVSAPMRIRITTNKLYSYLFGRDLARL